MTHSSHDGQGPLWAHSAVALAELIRRRVVSSREVVQAHLDRIEKINPDVNAVTAVMADALTHADNVDARLAAGQPVGALAGVPFTVKDNIDVVGQPTTDG